MLYVYENLYMSIYERERQCYMLTTRSAMFIKSVIMLYVKAGP